MKRIHCGIIVVVVWLMTLGTLAAYDFEYDAGNIEGSKTSTGITYTLSVSKGNLGTSYDFDTRAGVTSGSPSGIDIDVTQNGATGTVIYANNSLPSSNFTISMNGKLIPPSGGSGGRQPTWCASGEAKAPFHIKSNQNDGAKEIVVPAGTSVTYTAYEGTSSKASNWTVNGQTQNNESSIIFNRSWWDEPGWFSTSMGTPDPGIYNISAVPTDRPGVSDSGSMTVVGIASISGHGKSSSRSTPPDNWTDTEIIYAQPKSVINLTINLDPDVTPDDNLKASISWSVSGMFTTITPNESKLGATFIPDSTGSYIVTASCGQSQRLICIKVAAPTIYSVSFGGNIQILRDNGVKYTGVSWQDNDLDGSSDLSNENADSSKKYQPVAYCSTATMSATAVFKLNYKDSVGKYVNYDVEAAVKKLRFTPYSFGTLDNWSNPVNFNMSGTEVTAAKPLRDKAEVGYHNCYELAWEVGFGEAGTPDSNLSWERCYTEHELYLTWRQAPPQKTEVTFYETVLHIGCTNANGKSDDQQIVSSIWGAFSQRNMTRKGSIVTLTYYGDAALGINYNINSQGTKNLFRHDSGRCGDWSKFFIDIVKAQEISSCEEIVIRPKKSNGLLVKNWIFPQNQDYPTFLYPYRMANVRRGTGIPGQGLFTPKAAWFDNHALVKYGSTVYDPSYGLTYAAGPSFLNDIEIAALDGYTVEIMNGGDIISLAGLIHVDDLTE